MNDIEKAINEDIIRAILNSIRNALNEEADKAIKQKVAEFEKQLISNKNNMIAEMLNAIEIHSNQNISSLSTEFNIFIRPNYILKK